MVPIYILKKMAEKSDPDSSKAATTSIACTGQLRKQRQAAYPPAVAGIDHRDHSETSGSPLNPNRVAPPKKHIPACQPE